MAAQKKVADNNLLNVTVSPLFWKVNVDRWTCVKRTYLDNPTGKTIAYKMQSSNKHLLAGRPRYGVLQARTGRYLSIKIFRNKKAFATFRNEHMIISVGLIADQEAPLRKPVDYWSDAGHLVTQTRRFFVAFKPATPEAPLPPPPSLSPGEPLEQTAGCAVVAVEQDGGAGKKDGTESEHDD